MYLRLHLHVCGTFSFKSQDCSPAEDSVAPITGKSPLHAHSQKGLKMPTRRQICMANKVYSRSRLHQPKP